MTPENFVYWLQGFLEIEAPKNVTEEQIKIINAHIALVLKKETPNFLGNFMDINDKKIFQPCGNIPHASC